MNPSMPEEPVEVLITTTDSDLTAPSYAHPGDAGADLPSAENVRVDPGERVVVRTGMAIAIPRGYVGLVHPRSGLAARHGLSVLNAPGTIDAGYRGEVTVCVINTDPATPVRLSRGDRIAQLVIQPVSRAAFRLVPELPDSARGDDGYGSTGGHAGLAQTGDPGG